MNGPFKIVKRPTTGNYTLRFYVPLRYQAAFGKREVWKSLGTPDRNKAKELAPTVGSEILNQIKAACAESKLEPAATVVEPTREQIDQAARYVYAAEVQSDLDELADVASSRMRGKTQSANESRRHSEEVMRASLRGDFSATNEEYWRDDFKFSFKPGSPRESEFRQRMAWAYSEAAKRWAEHDEFIYGGESSNPLFKGIVISSADDSSFPKHPSEAGAPVEPTSEPLRGAPVVSATSSAKTPLSALWGSYERQRCAGVRTSTKNDKQRMVKLFSEFVGILDPQTQSQNKTRARGATHCMKCRGVLPRSVNSAANPCVR